jgi:hypothetical protein
MGCEMLDMRLETEVINPVLDQSDFINIYLDMRFETELFLISQISYLKSKLV